MFSSRNDNKYTRTYSFPATKLRNVFCTHCKHQFFLQEFVPLRGLVPLLLECGHVICDKCAKLSVHDPCPLCNTISQSLKEQKVSLPLNMYALGLMVMSHNRPVDDDDCDISFSESANSKVKQKSIQGLCYECGIQATIKCPQCAALYCLLCYSKIHGKALQSHSKIMLSGGINHNSSFAIKNTCSEQCTESLGYYCENCKVAGCSHCMLQLHKQHNYKSLLEKNQDLLPEFYKVSQCVAENLQRIHQAQKKLSRIAAYPKETRNIDSVETSVTQHFAHLHGVLQNLERKIIDTLNDHRNARSKNIEDLFQQLKAHEIQLQSAILITASVAENLDKIDIQEVIKKLQELESIPCHLMLSSIPDNEQEVKFDANKDIINIMKQHYTIEIPSTSSYNLRRTDSLPDDYKLEPLTEELNISILTRPPMANKPTPTISMAPKKCDELPVIGPSEMVRVTHIVNPSCFHVQMIQNKGRISELERGLASLANTTGIIPTTVTINTLYIVQCLKDKTWHRARVIDKKSSNGDEKYSVFYIDYGMKEDNVPLGKIRNIVPQYATLPMMAIRCALYDIVPNGGKWHPDAIEAFTQLVYSSAMVSMSVHEITGDTYYVDLSVMSAKDWHVTSVKDSLTYMKFATCVSPSKLMRINPDSTKVYYKEQLELGTYMNVEILFVESPNCIYVRKTQANRSYFNKLISDMAESYGQSLSCNDLIPVLSKDLPCAARAADGAWHRGIIKEVTENTISVFYVDLGYTLMLNYDAVRALPKKYMSCKTQAIKVSLKSIKPRYDKEQWDQDTTDYLRRVLRDLKIVKLIAFDNSEDTYSVAMFTLEKKNIIHMLLEQDLALQNYSGHRFENKKKRNKLNKDIVTKFDKKSRNFKKQCADSTAENSVERAIENPLENPNEVTNTSVKNRSTEEPEDPFKIGVQIHQAQSPDCIYVSNPTRDQNDTETMMARLQEFYKKYRSAKRDVWNENTVCVVFLRQTETYHRGRVMKVKSADKVTVFLYDQGAEETVTIDDLQPLHPSFFEISTHVFKIKLSGILPCGGSSSWPSLSCEKLREIVSNNHSCKFYISKLEEEETDDTAIPVELWIKQVKMDGPLAPTRYEINSINRMLVEHGVALPIKEYAKKRDKILAHELKKMLQRKLERLAKCEPNVKWFEISKDLDNPVDIGMNKAPNNLGSDLDNIDLDLYDYIPSLPKLNAWLPAEPIYADSFIAMPTYLDHDGFLYLHSKEQNTETLQSIEKKLERYSNLPLESCDTVWVAGDLCIAQYHFNKKWYRGKVLNVLENNMINVEFVDYGNVEECAVGTVKKRVILEDVPIQCTKCLIHGLIPGRPNGRWTTNELDRIHAVLIEKECRVTVLDRTKTHLVISITLLPGQHCLTETDLITFLVNDWEIDLKQIIDTSVSDASVCTTDSPDAIIEETKLFFYDSDLLKEPIISGNSILTPNMVAANKDDSCDTNDIENLSWRKVNIETISSTPQVASEENLLITFRTLDIPEDTKLIEIELCYSLSTTEFYAHIKENAHSKTINSYYNQYQLIMEDLQENACKQEPITNFAPNTPCCAKYSEDDTWYRSVIIESEPVVNSDSTEVKLLYVDYGNCEIRTVNSEQRELFTLKKEWMDLPLMVIKCELWNIEVVPDVNIEDFLPELEKLYNRNVIAAIKKIDQEVTYIELYDDKDCKELLYNSLIEEGLFQFSCKEKTD